VWEHDQFTNSNSRLASGFLFSSVIYKYRFLFHRLFFLCVELEFVEVVALFDALVAVWFILKRYQPVALQISKHTLEQYHNKSNVTKIIQIQSSFLSENIVPKYWLRKRASGARNTLSNVSSSLFVIWATMSLLVIFDPIMPNTKI